MEQKPKKWYKKWWVITLFVILFLGAIGNLAEETSTAITPPKEIAKTYFDNYDNSFAIDYEVMYNSLASSVKPESVEHLKVKVENSKQAFTLSLSSCKFVEVKNEQIQGDKATVDVVYKTNTMGFKSIETKPVNLTKEGDNWKLEKIHLC